MNIEVIKLDLSAAIWKAVKDLIVAGIIQADAPQEVRTKVISVLAEYGLLIADSVLTGIAIDVISEEAVTIPPSQIN